MDYLSGARSKLPILNACGSFANLRCVFLFVLAVLVQTGPNDLRHFDPEFTDEPVPNSIGCSSDSALVTASINEAFVGFSYAPSMDSYL